MKLNLGCGKDIKKGWLNCDYLPGEGVDKVFDASEPFPFDANIFDEVLASHVLEHIQNWPDVILECHRVLKPNGMLEVRVPYGIGSHNYDPTHVRFFWPNSLDNFFVKPKTTSNEPYAQRKLFDLIYFRVRRIFWFRQYLIKYLKVRSLENKYDFPLGIKVEIIWRLRKVA